MNKLIARHGGLGVSIRTTSSGQLEYCLVKCRPNGTYRAIRTHTFVEFAQLQQHLMSHCNYVPYSRKAANEFLYWLATEVASELLM